MQLSPVIIRDKLIELCKKENIVIKDGEYQILLERCIEYLSEECNAPEKFVTYWLAGISSPGGMGLVSTRRGSESRKWYIIIEKAVNYSEKGNRKKSVVEEASDDRAS